MHQDEEEERILQEFCHPLEQEAGRTRIQGGWWRDDLESTQKESTGQRYFEDLINMKGIWVTGSPKIQPLTT